MFPGFSRDSLPALQEARESRTRQERGALSVWNYDCGHISELLTLRPATSCVESGPRRGSGGSFLGGASRAFPSSPFPLPNGCVRITLRTGALCGALLLGHCLLRMTLKVELILFPSSCSCQPCGGLRGRTTPRGDVLKEAPGALGEAVLLASERGSAARRSWACLTPRCVTWVLTYLPQSQFPCL